MSDDWRNELASEQQKEKLRFFGCTWDDGITAGQAEDALAECAIQFPDAEATWQKNQPAREDQKEKLRYFGCTWNGGINVGQAIDALLQCASDFPDKEAAWQFQKKKWSKVAGSFPATPQSDTPVKTAPAQNPQAQKSFHVSPRRVTTIKSPRLPGNISTSSKQHDEAISNEVPISKAESVESQVPDVSDETPQQYLERKGRAQDPSWQRWVLDKAKQARDFLSRKNLTYDAARQMAETEWHEWIGLHGSYGTEPGHKLTYGDARKMSEREWNNWSVSHGRQVARQSDTVGDQTATPVYIPPSPEQFAEIRAFGKVPPKGLTLKDATTWIEQLKIFFAPKTGQLPPEPTTVERNDWRTAPATEKQKEKLRLLGCTFDDNITVGIAKLLIERHKAESEISHPSVRREGFFSGESQPETRKTEAPSCQSTKEWDEWIALQERIKKRSIPFDELPAQEVTIQEASKPQNSSSSEYAIPAREVQSFAHQQANETTNVISQSLAKYIADLKSWDKQVRYLAAIALGQSKNQRSVKPLIDSLADSSWGVRLHAARSLGELGFPDAVEALIEALKDRDLKVRKEAAEALGKIKDIRAFDALATTLRDREEYVRAAAAVARDNIKGNKPAYATVEECSHDRYSAPQVPAIQKPTTYISSIPIERFENWLDIVIKRNNTCLGGHWLPVGPVDYPLKQYTTITGVLSRQIADLIEARGYCVEPDARFGNGKYDNGHTLALFKPFDGDPIHPSMAYLGAANLLRLCMLITTADGQIDLVELDVFRKAIEHQPGLTRTDHKRLLILEQLLAQELSSAKKTAAKIAKSISAEKRLVIGKLLVEVAAANNVITHSERFALEEIFTSLKISQMMLKHYINQYCPKPDSYGVQDVSAENRFQWDNWRTNHSGIVIDDDVLVGKTWNFTDWKSLNARWRDLHERLVVEQLTNLPNADKSEAGVEADNGINPKKVSALVEFLAAGRLLGANAENTAKQVDEICPLCGWSSSKCCCATSDTPPERVTEITRKADDRPVYDRLATQEQLDELRKNGIEAGRGIRYAEAKELIESCRSLDKENKIQDDEPKEPIYLEYPIEPSNRVFTQSSLDHLHKIWAVEYNYTEAKNRRLYKEYLETVASWNAQRGGLRIANPKPFPEPPMPEVEQPATEQQHAPTSPSYYSRVTPEQLKELRSYGENPTSSLIYYGAAKTWIENCKARKQPATSLHPDLQEVQRGGNTAKIPNSKAEQEPRAFALDMERVYQITNETKEVVAILSVVMADEPEESIKLPTKITMPVPETPRISSDSKDAPQPTRFNGLDAAFHPILERLLTRDSWPVDDFNALAREFHFMPGKICETINEWSDEALGEFILDGDAPVVIRRELIANEKIYG